MCLGVKGCIDDMCYTVRCRYGAVIFLTNIHNRHHITRPLGRGIGCLFASMMSWFFKQQIVIDICTIFIYIVIIAAVRSSLVVLLVYLFRFCFGM